MATRALLVVAWLVISTPAFASPVTFSFTAGDLFGSYQFDTLSPGEQTFQDEIPAGMHYANAVQSFEVFNAGTLLMSGSSGDIHAMVYGGEWGEYFYGVTLTAAHASIRLFVWSAAGDPIITTEAIDAVPDFSSYVAERSLFVMDGPPDDWQWHPLTSLGAVTEPTEQRSSQAVTVSEPATWLLSVLGLGILGAARHRRRPPNPRPTRPYCTSSGVGGGSGS